MKEEEKTTSSFPRKQLLALNENQLPADYIWFNRKGAIMFYDISLPLLLTLGLEPMLRIPRAGSQ